jgi:hypothetical protein
VTYVEIVPLFWAQLNAILKGVFTIQPKTPDLPHNGSQTPPNGVPDTGRPAARPRPTSLRDLQGDKHRLRLRYKLALTFLLVAI